MNCKNSNTVNFGSTNGDICTNADVTKTSRAGMISNTGDERLIQDTPEYTDTYLEKLLNVAEFGLMQSGTRFDRCCSMINL